MSTTYTVLGGLVAVYLAWRWLMSKPTNARRDDYGAWRSTGTRSFPS